MSFSVVGAHVCVDLFYFVYLFIGEGLVAGLWGLLATGGGGRLLAKRRLVLGT